MRTIIICAGLLALAACSALPFPDNADTDRIEARIVAACTASGLFRAVNGAVTMAVPVAALPVAAINAGVDLVCKDPARYAGDIGTAEWVARNLADIVKARAAVQR